MTEKSLSDEECLFNGIKVFKKEHVKEFIQKIDEFITSLPDGYDRRSHKIRDKIIKLAGKGLKE